MTTPIKNYKRGILPNQIEFDPARPSSTAGGNGDLYRAILHHSSHPNGSPFQYSYVALKRMRWGTDDEDNRLDHVLEEACVWKRLHHVNILRFLGILYENDDLYLVSPFATHGSLPQYIVVHPDANRRMFLWQIAAGIAYLHSQDVVHGDVKGANVLVFDGPTAKICDFGLSKIADGKQTTNSQYSLPWTSPERLSGEPRSFADDVYAFGITVYEILSGEIPFRHLDTFVKFFKAVVEEMVRPPKQSAHCYMGISYVVLWMVAEDCWQDASHKRPSMNVVRDFIVPDETITDLMDILDDLPVFSNPSLSSDITSRRGKRVQSAVELTGISEFRISSGEGSFRVADVTHAAEPCRTAKRSKLLHCVPGENLDVGATTSIQDHSLGSDTVSHSSSVPTPAGTFPRVDSLLRATSASHRAARANAPTVCLEGTRTAVLEKVYEWARSMDSNMPRVFWLNGMAGTGKSTIAQTLAEQAEKEGTLGASFFFSRHGDAEVRNARLVIPTIAFQLAVAIPLFKSCLAKELEKEPDAPHAVRHRQVNMLLATPLQAIKRSKPLVLVVDALDECEGRDAAELLQLLLAMISGPATPPTLKLFITCRPDRDLNLVFQRAQVHQKFLLHDVELDIVQIDIERYLRNGLTNPPPDLLPSNWISTTDLKELVRRAGKLFVYATTTLKYICDNRFDPPYDRLQLLLSASHGTGENPLADLDDLYLQVLRAAIGSPARQVPTAILNRVIGRIQCVLGALVIARSQLPLIVLAKLLGMSKDQTRKALEHLQSVIITPESDQEPPRFLHQSFPDFIISPDRCQDHRFLVDISKQERYMAIRCLRIMTTGLKRNIAGSEGEMAITPELKYACCYWASHLVKSLPGDKDVLIQLGDFANRCLLWWLEALSWTGQVAVAARAADDAFKWAVLSIASKSTISLLHDVHRFVLAHLSCISEYPNDVYFSALPFTPRSTSLWKLYEHEAALSVRVLSGVEEDWSPCLSVLTSHKGPVKTFKLSPDGTRIVSGSYDNTVRIWDAVSGQCIATLEGHSGAVRVMALSADGTRIVSGSDDNTVRVWDAVSGQCTAMMEGHSERVWTIALSADGTRIVSGSDDKTARIWDAVSGRCTATLEGHSDSVSTIALSADGTRIVSGSDDNTVRIWDAISDQYAATTEGQSDEAIAIPLSSDRTQAVSGSKDNAVRIWDALSTQCSAMLEGHSENVTTFALSPDGTRIVSRSQDKTVRIWDALSGQCTATLEGHSKDVATFVLSADGTRIVSGSWDNTVRIWDAVSGQCTATLEGHSGPVITIALSADGTGIVSGSDDETVRIWDAVSGQCTAMMEGHSDGVSSIALSADGTRVVSGSWDEVRVWDAVSGHCIAKLDCKDKDIDALAFSPSGTQILVRLNGDLHGWDFTSAPSDVVVPLPPDADTLPFETIGFPTQYEYQDEYDFDYEPMDEVEFESMRSKWATFVDVPAFTICGLQVRSAKIFPDRRVVSVRCTNDRNFLLYYPSRSL